MPPMTNRFEDLFHTSMDGFQPDKKKRVGGYVLGGTLGEGSFAKVRLGTHVLTKERVAVKIINKKLVNKREYVRRNMRREATLLQRVDHPNIVRLFEVMETQNSYYIVLELADGGEFIKYINDRQHLEDSEARKFMRQIISAVDHMHRSGVVHRDLKIENFLLDKDLNIKLIDFGLGNLWDGQNLLNTQCGSPAYAAPEIFSKRQYGASVDIWSLGVNLYAMLTGNLPFLVEPPNNLSKLHSLIMRGCRVPDYLSPDAKDLILRMLEPMESKRLTMRDLLSHPWVNSEYLPLEPWELKTRLPSTEINETILKYMAQKLNYSESAIRDAVINHKANAMTANYNLLLTRMDRGLGLPDLTSSQQALRDRIVYERQSVFRKFQMEVEGLPAGDVHESHKENAGKSETAAMDNMLMGESVTDAKTGSINDPEIIINHIPDSDGVAPNSVNEPSVKTPKSSYRQCLKQLQDKRQKSILKREVYDPYNLPKHKGITPRSTKEYEAHTVILEDIADIRDSGITSSSSANKDAILEPKSVKFKMTKSQEQLLSNTEMPPLKTDKFHLLPHQYHASIHDDRRLTNGRQVRAMVAMRKSGSSPPPAPPNSALGRRDSSSTTDTRTHTTCQAKEPPVQRREASNLDKTEERFYDKYRFKVPTSEGGRTLFYDAVSPDPSKSSSSLGTKSKTMPNLRLRKLGALTDRKVERPPTRDTVPVDHVGAVFKIKEYNKNIWKSAASQWNGQKSLQPSYKLYTSMWDSQTSAPVRPKKVYYLNATLNTERSGRTSAASSAASFPAIRNR